MIRGIFTAASGLGVLQSRMDTTSNNLANVSTNGFKQDRVQTASFPDLMLQEKVRVNVGGLGFGGWWPVGVTNQGAVVTGVFTDHSTGVLSETGNETDLALSGEGYFSFQPGGQGENRILYSRDGQLHRDSEGYLVNSGGDRILGESGPVQVGSGSFTVSPEGVVTTADGTEIKLEVVGFQDKTRLVKEGNGYFSARPGEATAAENPGVTQRFLEKSNVDVTAEMVNMIEIARAYEATQKLVQAQDQMLDNAINRVGTVK